MNVFPRERNDMVYKENLTISYNPINTKPQSTASEMTNKLNQHYDSLNKY